MCAIRSLYFTGATRHGPPPLAGRNTARPLSLPESVPASHPSGVLLRGYSVTVSVYKQQLRACFHGVLLHSFYIHTYSI
jgi:hypothetical protein